VRVFKQLPPDGEFLTVPCLGLRANRSPEPEYYESRAIVLSKMGNHKQALQIYVFQVKDYQKAEE
jgi:hypothetical protein